MYAFSAPVFLFAIADIIASTLKKQTMNNKQLWDGVLTEMETVVPGASFKMWFKDTGIIKNEDGIVYVAVPNLFAKEWFLSKYHKSILKSLRTLSEHIRAVEYLVTKETPIKTEEKPRKIELNPTTELPLADLYLNKDDNLNPRYTFDSFVVGPFNELAHAAAQSIAKEPGSNYNPYFIYGDTGRGKTHLIQAIGNHIKKLFPSKKVYYITSEKYYLEHVNAVLNNKTPHFKEKYRAYDVFIMDDIQFLSHKEKTQEELFHLFNVLHDNNKQIIFSSDKSPHYIPNLEDRLKSRFLMGMTVDIPAPDHESRVAILKAKTLSQNLILSEDILSYLAETFNNIRELEGVLNSIMHQINFKKRDLSLLEIRQLVKENARPKKTISLKEVVKIITDFYNIEEHSIYEKTRKKEVVKPRQVIMYILREDLSISYPTIGEKLGGRDHTTVIHSCEKIKHDLKEDVSLFQEVQQIRALMQ
jgi:chromosomal replication initiator protein